MSYVVVYRFTTTSDLSTGTYATPKDLYLGITDFNETGQSFIVSQETRSGTSLPAEKRDSLLNTWENASFVIIEDYVSVDKELTFESEAHWDAFKEWHGAQTFNEADHYNSPGVRYWEDTWSRTLVSEG